MFVSSPFAFSAENELSKDAQQLLKEFKNLTDSKVRIPVEISRLEVDTIAMKWQLTLDSDKSIYEFIVACVAGYYDYAGMVIGQELVKNGKITQAHYDLLRNNCVGKNGIGIKTLSMWNTVIKETKKQNYDLKSLVQY